MFPFPIPAAGTQGKKKIAEERRLLIRQALSHMHWARKQGGRVINSVLHELNNNWSVIGYLVIAWSFSIVLGNKIAKYYMIGFH